MRVEFEFKLSGNSRLREADLTDDFASAQKRLSAVEDPEGGVLFMNDNGQAEASFGDDLEALIDRLCIHAVPVLSEHQPFRLEYFAYPGHVDFQPDGAMIHVSGSDISPHSFASGELLPALLDCAERYLGWMDQLPSAAALAPRRARQRENIQTARAKLAAV